MFSKGRQQNPIEKLSNNSTAIKSAFNFFDFNFLTNI